jgi:hypothetical protein
MLVQSKTLLKLCVLLGWAGACYALRFQLMEDSRWVELCDGANTAALCQLRAGLGLTIHWQLLAWAALATALPAFFISSRTGRRLAWFSFLFALPALALYTVTLAVFALLIAALRIVRLERHNENVSSNATAAQPNA